MKHPIGPLAARPRIRVPVALLVALVFLLAIGPAIVLAVVFPRLEGAPGPLPNPVPVSSWPTSTAPPR